MTDPAMPDYKGEPLDADRGPGLGCFWAQVILLVALLVLTPVSVLLSAPSWLSAALLIVLLVLLFFVGQTMIFLLRLVAADRRTRRQPLSSDARRTVGQLEDETKPRSREDEAERRLLILAIVRGERPWQELREHGFIIHEGPPFDDMHVPAGASVKVSLDDLITGLRAQVSQPQELRMWAFAVLAMGTDFGDMTDTAMGKQVVSLLHDAALPGVNAAAIRSRLADLDVGESSNEDHPAPG